MVRRKKDEAQAGELTPLEEAVMAVVWQLGECSSAEVIAQYNDHHEPLAKTTIRTVLANLREKGFLTPVPTTERGFRLRATVTRNDFAARTLRQITRRLLNGNPRHAITCLCRQFKNLGRVGQLAQVTARIIRAEIIEYR